LRKSWAVIFMPGSSPAAVYYASRTSQESGWQRAKDISMARDSQAALVALNRFGFGARGGASGDLINAASILAGL
jgi:hypothetical protein